MLLKELIDRLSELYKKQGDCDIAIDAPNLQRWYYDFEIVDKWYNANRFYEGKPTNQGFLLIKTDVDTF